MAIMQGKIIKGIAGFYYVHIPGKNIYECKAKGVFRNMDIKPLVGDDVEIDIVDDKKLVGNITRILPRHSELLRPAVANVEQALLVFAMSEPAPNLRLLDSFLVMMGQYGLNTVICFNKADETDKTEIGRLRSIYMNCGAPVVITSTKTGENIDELKKYLTGKTTALAGPSGVGKSSILNVLIPEAGMQTGSISEKIGRGRHTTRHSEVFVMDGGSYILDTPGFTSLTLTVEPREDLRLYIPEFEEYEGRCRYGGCVHINEPGCVVKEAVCAGKIHKLRYEHYTQMFAELDRKRY